METAAISCPQMEPLGTMFKVQEFSYPFPSNALIILHSDGLTTHWNMDAYPGLIVKPPSLIAGVLYRDFQRGNDDVTVVAARAT